MNTANNTVGNFIHARHIDSYQKLYVLLFLSRHTELIATSRQLAEQLFLGDLSLLEEIINDLCREGLVDYVADGYVLHNEPDTQLGLQRLAEAFEDPLDRQEILDQVTNGSSLNHYQEYNYESY
jgi:DNA-binding IscR family transcriptional regulator